MNFHFNSLRHQMVSIRVDPFSLSWFSRNRDSRRKLRVGEKSTDPRERENWFDWTFSRVQCYIRVSRVDVKIRGRKGRSNKKHLTNERGGGIIKIKLKDVWYIKSDNKQNPAISVMIFLLFNNPSCKTKGKGGGRKKDRALQTNQEEKVRFNWHYCYDFVTLLLL